MIENYVLDTHVLIWYFVGSDRLRSRQKEKIEQVRNRGGHLLIPTIVLAEALDVAEKSRVEFDFSSMYDLIQKHESFEIIGFSQAIFEKTRQVEKIPEIHDRIIAATASFYESGVMTKDEIIEDSDEIQTL